MAPIAIEQPESQSSGAKQPLIKPWARPRQTSEDLDWADLPTIDLSRFDEPGGKQALARDLLDAVTRVGFWVVVGSGIDDERVLRQFSIGNAFFKEPLDEKRRFPCNFADGEYFGYRENSRWIGDTGVKENIEMVCFLFPLPVFFAFSLLKGIEWGKTWTNRGGRVIAEHSQGHPRLLERREAPGGGGEL